MLVYTILASAGAVGFLCATLYRAITAKPAPKSTENTVPKGSWIAPAVLSSAFFVYSVYTISEEGFTGFWIDHTRNFWGIQIWFDLLLGIGTGFYFLVPKAKTVDMYIPFWYIAVPATGCIGLCAMTSRCLYLWESLDISSNETKPLE
uniref:Uncharacterized protein n=1 Tax=Timspurckia oligopyrenoides TaxID=708627 RepID=A0A7S0ZF20_9RHOD|mmetsp:Transcript_2648/g.4673  ORF Transcript_2648/g.4673 Transcript_2648/m.4673 type:complete len:148 (+) Transcript_2648:245-688(+)